MAAGAKIGNGDRLTLVWVRFHAVRVLHPLHPFPHCSLSDMYWSFFTELLVPVLLHCKSHAMDELSALLPSVADLFRSVRTAVARDVAYGSGQ